MKTIIHIFAVLGLLLSTLNLVAQKENSNIRSGNKKFENEKYEEAEVEYKKAIEKNLNSFKATFNLGDSYFKQKKYEEALKEFRILTGKETDKKRLANVYYNIGNCFVQLGQLDAAEEAYKQSLRNNPMDLDTKYNLEFVRHMKKNQQNQQNQQNQNQQQQDKQDQKQENGDKQQQNQNTQDKQGQQQQQQKDKLDKKDAERMLEALQNDEQKTKEKVDEQRKMQSKKVRIEKDW
ncbi:MAG: tetratricopeptide repeat protein [Bacteroidales bacterium]